MDHWHWSQKDNVYVNKWRFSNISAVWEPVQYIKYVYVCNNVHRARGSVNISWTKSFKTHSIQTGTPKELCPGWAPWTHKLHICVAWRVLIYCFMGTHIMKRQNVFQLHKNRMKQCVSRHKPTNSTNQNLSIILNILKSTVGLAINTAICFPKSCLQIVPNVMFTDLTHTSSSWILSTYEHHWMESKHFY